MTLGCREVGGYYEAFGLDEAVIYYTKRTVLCFVLWEECCGRVQKITMGKLGWDVKFPQKLTLLKCFWGRTTTDITTLM
jgi:hypothetical protein